MNEKLKKINNELKVYINESNFISTKCRNKIIKLLANEFSVTLPLENFKNIDIVLKEDGTIIMRGDEYSSTNPVNSIEELEEKYNAFKEKADVILKKKEINYSTKADGNNIKNLIVVFFMLLLFIALLAYAIRSFFLGSYIHCIWLIMFITYTLIPSTKVTERLEQAINYIKRKMKK